MTFRLFCYGKPYADQPTLYQAKVAANAHIRDCPNGAMEWAKRITWHHADLLTPPTWVSAAKGEWLDHSIREVPE